MRTLRGILSRRMARKVGIAVAGFSVLLVGLVMIVLPGPAVLVIPLGLTILSKEYPWANRLMLRLQTLVNSQATAARRWLLLTSRRARVEAAATVRWAVRVSRIHPRNQSGARPRWLHGRRLKSDRRGRGVGPKGRRSEIGRPARRTARQGCLPQRGLSRIFGAALFLAEQQAAFHVGRADTGRGR